MMHFQEEALTSSNSLASASADLINSLDELLNSLTEGQTGVEAQSASSSGFLVTNTPESQQYPPAAAPLQAGATFQADSRHAVSSADVSDSQDGQPQDSLRHGMAKTRTAEANSPRPTNARQENDLSSVDEVPGIIQPSHDVDVDDNASPADAPQAKISASDALRDGRPAAPSSPEGLASSLLQASLPLLCLLAATLGLGLLLRLLFRSVLHSLTGFTMLLLSCNANAWHTQLQLQYSSPRPLSLNLPAASPACSLKDPPVCNSMVQELCQR